MDIERSSGILMPISSLPSPYGVGTLGQSAYDFIDFLHSAGQRWWQLLPMGPTGYGDSPYSALSSFAGNPYFIDLDMLMEDGLLTRKEAEAHPWGSDPEHVDYKAVAAGRFDVLRLAYRRGRERDAAAFGAFCTENARWLNDYALFMALKRQFDGAPWTEWPEDIRLRRPEACARWRERLADDIGFFSYVQFLFFRQWDALRAYAKENGVGLIGDIPIYVPLDSADVWAEPQWFELDDRNLPTAVSGCPPDYFNEDGQLWGNPLYRWDEMAVDGYGWWIRRVDGAFRFCDALRFDHFRGLESYWAVPAGESTARNGEWRKGPGMAFVGPLRGWFHDRAFIAEDLGFMTPEVRQLLSDSGFPGMKVLQFAFDWREPSDYLPHTYTHNCVCYTGTHDNETLAGWIASVDKRCLAHAKEYLGLSRQEGYRWGIIRGGMASTSRLFVAQMQDYLGLGNDARMNVPGTPQGNWRWRMKADALTPALAERLLRMTKLYGRLPWRETVDKEASDEAETPPAAE